MSIRYGLLILAVGTASGLSGMEEVAEPEKKVIMSVSSGKHIVELTYVDGKHEAWFDEKGVDRKPLENKLSNCVLGIPGDFEPTCLAAGKCGLSDRYFVASYNESEKKGFLHGCDFASRKSNDYSFNSPYPIRKVTCKDDKGNYIAHLYPSRWRFWDIKKILYVYKEEESGPLSKQDAERVLNYPRVFTLAGVGAVAAGLTGLAAAVWYKVKSKKDEKREQPDFAQEQ